MVYEQFYKKDLEELTTKVNNDADIKYLIEELNSFGIRFVFEDELQSLIDRDILSPQITVAQNLMALSQYLYIKVAVGNTIKIIKAGGHIDSFNLPVYVEGEPELAKIKLMNYGTIFNADYVELKLRFDTFIKSQVLPSAFYFDSLLILKIYNNFSANMRYSHKLGRDTLFDPSIALTGSLSYNGSFSKSTLNTAPDLKLLSDFSVVNLKRFFHTELQKAIDARPYF